MLNYIQFELFLIIAIDRHLYSYIVNLKLK